MPSEADYYSPAEAADLLGLAEFTVLGMLTSGQLEGHQDEQAGWRIPAAVVDEAVRRSRDADPLADPSTEETIAMKAVSPDPQDSEDPTRGQSRPDDAVVSGLSGWVTTDVAARAVRVSPRTIRRYIDRGELKAKVEGEGVERRWLVDVDSLHALRASRPESDVVREVSGAEESADRIADMIREMAARVEERTAEAVEMRIRLELSEQAHSTVEEEARRLREENERLRQELESLRETTRGPQTAAEEPYSTHPPGPDHPVERPSW